MLHVMSPISCSLLPSCMSFLESPPPEFHFFMHKLNWKKISWLSAEKKRKAACRLLSRQLGRRGEGGGWFMGHSQDGSAHSVSAVKRQVMRITEYRVGFCPHVRFWQWPIRVHEEIRFRGGGSDCEDEQPCTDITLFCRRTSLCSGDGVRDGGMWRRVL